MTEAVTPVTVGPGDARCPGPSTRDLILGDSTPTPAALLEESYAFAGDDDVPYEEFTSPAFADAEHDHVWSRTWQWACRHEHIPEPGDYYVYDIGDRSVLIVRGPDGSIKAFHNACLHRGTQLKPPGSIGFSQKLRCPFMGVLPEHFANWDLADRYVEVHIRKRLPANWKASAEAFLEAYHILETHSQSIYTAGDANAQYDVFGDHVSRFIHTIGTTSPHVPEAKRPDEQGILNMLMARKNPGHDVPEIPDGERARDVYARHMQAVLGEQYDNDFSHLSVTETIDSVEYFLFPNAFFFPGLQIPLCYRFRPDGPDPDRCIYEVLYLRPKPRSGPTPQPADPVDLDVDDSYTTVPGLPTSLGQVLDQDTVNLAAQTRGFKASKKRGQTLGNYQEIRARHFQSTVRRYIAEGQSTPDR